MIVNKMKDYLDREGIRYVIVIHSPAYTAQEIAASAHIPGKELAKTVMINLDGHMAMAVLPASYRVNFGQIKAATGATTVTLATEEQFLNTFPGCEIGAMPPFGNLYDMPVYVADTLAEDQEIAFNAGVHRELVRMRYEDFARLVKPTVIPFSTKCRN